jgi:hypothetical protein
MGLGFLGYDRVEIEALLLPLYAAQIRSPSQLSRNVLAGVAKGFAPASFGEQEKEL